MVAADRPALLDARTISGPPAEVPVEQPRAALAHRGEVDLGEGPDAPGRRVEEEAAELPRSGWGEVGGEHHLVDAVAVPVAGGLDVDPGGVDRNGLGEVDGTGARIHELQRVGGAAVGELGRAVAVHVVEGDGWRGRRGHGRAGVDVPPGARGPELVEAVAVDVARDGGADGIVGAGRRPAGTEGAIDDACERVEDLAVAAHDLGARVAVELAGPGDVGGAERRRRGEPLAPAVEREGAGVVVEDAVLLARRGTREDHARRGHPREADPRQLAQGEPAEDADHARAVEHEQLVVAVTEDVADLPAAHRLAERIGPGPQELDDRPAAGAVVGEDVQPVGPLRPRRDMEDATVDVHRGRIEEVVLDGVGLHDRAPRPGGRRPARARGSRQRRARPGLAPRGRGDAVEVRRGRAGRECTGEGQEGDETGHGRLRTGPASCHGGWRPGARRSATVL